MNMEKNTHQTNCRHTGIKLRRQEVAKKGPMMVCGGFTVILSNPAALRRSGQLRTAARMAGGGDQRAAAAHRRTAVQDRLQRRHVECRHGSAPLGGTDAAHRLHSRRTHFEEHTNPLHAPTSAQDRSRLSPVAAATRRFIRASSCARLKGYTPKFAIASGYSQRWAVCGRVCCARFAVDSASHVRVRGWPIVLRRTRAPGNLEIATGASERARGVAQK